eukprot:TRINITY_DN17919_c0_g3_i1.p2 TRINITY_DN17919_c0_g3~~TRINITY_DN17919_c0_g3_i1.p2  ORF type:complete len:578 (+),score=169.15 TRINITY_DN17919_c0_g3_i1:70-1734(+)
MPGAMLSGAQLCAIGLKQQGVEFCFGIVGYPILELGLRIQEQGIKYYHCRNEQAASYAAAAVGYLTGRPGAVIGVSGPGMVHCIAGAANAWSNCWPCLLIGGSSETHQSGLGAFQECPQVAMAAPVCKLSRMVDSARRIPFHIEQAVRTAVSGRPGAVYLDFPGDLLREQVDGSTLSFPPRCPDPPRTQADPDAVREAAALLKGAQRPLVVVGKGAAYAHAEEALSRLLDTTNIPFLPTPMGKGVVSDADPRCVGAARSAALAGADVVVLVGARLNWILHFGEAPRWAPDAHFILVDPAAEEGERRSALRGHAAPVLEQLQAGLGDWAVPFTGEWVAGLRAKAAENTAKSAARMAKPAPFPLDFTAAYACIAQEAGKLTAQPVWVSEGANTMDIGRQLLSVNTPRSRIDAGTWGTMGVGLGYAMAAAVTEPGRKVICLEGDSAFGFSAMELETLCRYGFDVCVIVFNNGGIYTGSGQVQPESQWPHDPAPTLFVPHARYDRMMAAFGGKGYCAASARELRSACAEAFRTPGPSLINLVIDPAAGVESGSMQAHN